MSASGSPAATRRRNSRGQWRASAARRLRDQPPNAGQDGKRAPRHCDATCLAIRLLRLEGHVNIAAANRHHARDPQRTLQLLQTA